MTIVGVAMKNNELNRVLFITHRQRFLFYYTTSLAVNSWKIEPFYAECNKTMECVIRGGWNPVWVATLDRVNSGIKAVEKIHKIEILSYIGTIATMVVPFAISEAISMLPLSSRIRSSIPARPSLPEYGRSPRLSGS